MLNHQAQRPQLLRRCCDLSTAGDHVLHDHGYLPGPESSLYQIACPIALGGFADIEAWFA